MYGYIYLTTNTINNKKYIGQHIGEFTTEYLGSGKVTLQGIVYSVIFTAAGQIVDMKVEDSSRKVL